MTVDEYEWYEIERLMLKSFTGGTLTDAEQVQVQKAYEASSKEYGERHQKIVRDEVDRRRRYGA
jgi:hypothetical protein